MKARFLIVLSLAMLHGPAAAQTVPALVNYQGQLTDAHGHHLPTADYTLTFRIFDAAIGGAEVWGPQVFDGGTGNGRGPRIPVVQGYFNVMLGPVDTAGRSLANAFNAPDRWVEITVGNNPPSAPRQQVLSAPFAIRSAFAQNSAAAQTAAAAQVAVNAQSLDGKVPGDFVAKAGGMMMGPLNLPANGLKVGTTQLMTESGNVGIGTATPGAKLEVASGDLLVREGILCISSTSGNGSKYGRIRFGQTNNAAIYGDDGAKLLSFATAGTSRMVIDGGGRVGIGTSLPQATLDVAGTLRVVAMAQQSLGKNGHVQIGDLLIQWGEASAYVDVIGETTVTLTFPRPFSSEVFVVVPGMLADTADLLGTTIAVRSITLTQVRMRLNEWAAVHQRIKPNYVAIGR